MTRPSEIPTEILDEMTPAVRGLGESLTIQMTEMPVQSARMQTVIDELKSEVKRACLVELVSAAINATFTFPSNSKDKSKVEEKSGWSEGASAGRSPTRSH